MGDEVTREAVVVDPGENVPEILARLARLKLTLKQIIITHAHIDHVGVAARLRAATGAPVIMHPADQPLLGMMEMQANWLGVPLPEAFTPDIDAAGGVILGPADGAPALRAQVLHTPGHTPGSVSLYFAPENLLLAGDTLFAGSIGRTDLPGGDGRRILASLRDRLMVLPEETHVVPGHGPETTIGRERETNPFLKPDFRL